MADAIDATAAPHNVVCDGVTDSASGIGSALTAAVNSGKKLVFPAGSCYSSTGLTVTIPSMKNLSIIGSGRETTKFLFGGGVNGLTVTYTDQTSSLTVKDLTFMTRSNGSGTKGLSLVMSSLSSSNPANSAQSVIDNVAFRGSDGYTVAHYWGYGLDIEGVSNVNFSNSMIACVNAGVGVSTSNSNGVTAVNITVDKSIVNYCSEGLRYGSGVQGIYISNTQFVGNVTGVHVVSGASNIDLLTIRDTHFNCTSYGIYDESGIADLAVTGNYFILPSSSAVGVQMNAHTGTFTGNNFNGIGTASSGAVGIVVGSTIASGKGLVIVGNTMRYVYVGVWPQSSSSKLVIANNKISASIPIYNQGANNITSTVQTDAGTYFLTTVTSGTTLTMALETDRLLLKNTSVVAAQTVKLPPITGAAGQMFWMTSIGGITALTVQDSSGNAVSNSPTTLAAGIGRAMISDGTTWFPAQ